MSRIYTTGSTGTIGKHLPKEVIPVNFNLAANEAEFESLDFESESHIIHLAGVVGPTEVSKNPRYARSVNIDGTRFLAKQFLRKSNGIFYFISTSHVYAPANKLISEISPLSPSNIYAEQKLEAEILLQGIFASESHRLCIIRVFSVLDWDAAPYTLGGAIRKMTNSDFILSNSSDIRDFLTPKSIAETIHKIASGQTQSAVLNLCSGSGTSVGEAAMRMLSESRFEIAKDRFTWDTGPNPYVVGDNSLLKSLHPRLELVWQPSTLN
jgi:nucleoside-diphosphate-sugar epimerase